MKGENVPLLRRLIPPTGAGATERRKVVADRRKAARNGAEWRRVAAERRNLRSPRREPWEDGRIYSEPRSGDIYVPANRDRRYCRSHSPAIPHAADERHMSE